MWMCLLCVVLGLPALHVVSDVVVVVVVVVDVLVVVSHCFCRCRSRRSSGVESLVEGKLFKWQLNSHKMKTRCLHCSYNFSSFLWHLKWLLDKGLTNGYCRIYGSCSLIL